MYSIEICVSTVSIIASLPYRFVAVGVRVSAVLYSIFKLQTRCRKCFSVRSEPLIVFT